jgi:hypothetical protein
MQMSDEALFIERNAVGKYEVKTSNATSARAVCDTQEEAIEQAKRMTTGAIHVERVRDTDSGARDKWRQI